VVEAEIYGDLTSMEVAQKNCESLKNLHKV